MKYVKGLIKVVPVRWRASGHHGRGAAGRIHVYLLKGGFSAQSRTFCPRGFERAFGIPVPERTTMYRVTVKEVMD